MNEKSAGSIGHQKEWYETYLFGARRMHGNGIVELLLGSTHLDRHREPLDHLVHADADTAEDDRTSDE